MLRTIETDFHMTKYKHYVHYVNYVQREEALSKFINLEINLFLS